MPHGLPQKMFVKGQVWSMETLRKRADALRGKKRTPEQCKRIGNGRRGIKQTKEAILKRTKTRRLNGWNKNPEETSRKMSLNNARANLGKKFSEETNKRKGLRKELNPNWQGGITEESDLIRKSDKYIEWRKKVLKRDNYTCQKYGVRGGELIAHHINNFSNNKELRLDINNGITLSKSAHQEFHRKYGIKNNMQTSNVILRRRLIIKFPWSHPATNAVNDILYKLHCPAFYNIYPLFGGVFFSYLIATR